MHIFNKNLSDSLKKKSVIKVIAGLDNTAIYKVSSISKAAELAGATYVDIAANTSILCILKSFIKIPICVSSIDSLELYNCHIAGADILEIGNFDIFYKKKIFFSSEDILQLAKETRALIPDKDICVTIPYYLSLLEQIKLSKSLEVIGINIIQTESCPRVLINNLDDSKDQFEQSTHKASDSLSSTYVLSNSTHIPIITSSGMNDLNCPIAVSYGASGVGIGSSIKNYTSLSLMSSYIRDIIQSLKLHDIKSNEVIDSSSLNSNLSTEYIYKLNTISSIHE